MGTTAVKLWPKRHQLGGKEVSGVKLIVFGQIYLAMGGA
jgi:hypothetical protein